MKNLKIQISLLIVLFSLGSLMAKPKKEMKLATITSERIVNVTPEQAWDILNSFGDVGSYHAGIKSSKSLHGSDVEGSMGCERQCLIKNGKKDLLVDESIIEYVEGSHYKYEAFSDDFPIKIFYNTFGVKVNDAGQTVIYVLTEFRLKPRIMTGLAKGKLRKGNEDALLFYKHYMETGEKNGDPDVIKEMYKNT